MEANFFRRLIDELGPALRGKRIEKVYQPLDNVWTLKLAGQSHLLFHSHPRNGFLFLAGSKPENPDTPSPRTQWWRKRLAGAKIVDWRSGWPNRQVAWRLGTDPAQWLVMDLQRGLELLQELPSGLGPAAEWPPLEHILDSDGIYKRYPHLSPPLRRTLNALDPARARKLLRELQEPAQGQVYHYTDPSGRQTLLPWALPEPLSRGCDLEIHPDAMTGARVYGWRLIRAMRAGEEVAGKERKRAIKRARRNLEKVRQDEERLRRMAELGDSAQLLQNNLYRLPYGQKLSSVQVLDAHGHVVDLELDPRRSVLDNMHDWFRQARKGRRGLEIQSGRRRELERQIQRLQDEAVEPPKSQGSLEPGPAARQGTGRSRWKGMNVHVFRSSDGFTIVRGRDRKANHRLLSQAAKPFDLWFHAQDGPGAHVVLRRDHEDQEVPRRSREEAAVIAGLASHFSMSDKARIVCALVRNVRKIKGAALGQVQVDKIRESLLVSLDSSLEGRLRLAPSGPPYAAEPAGPTPRPKR